MSSRKKWFWLDHSRSALSASRVDITLSDGRRVLIEGPTASDSDHRSGARAYLFSKCLEKGRFVWPAAKDSKVNVSGAQLSMLLEGIDWRMPQKTWLGSSTRNTDVIRWRRSEKWKSDRDKTLAIRGLSRKCVCRCALDSTEAASRSALPRKRLAARAIEPPVASGLEHVPVRTRNHAQKRPIELGLDIML